MASCKDIFQTEYLRQGATYEETFTDSIETADTVTITVSDDTGAIRLTESATYSTVDDTRVATISFNDPSLEVGTYSRMYTITYSDGFIDKLPSAKPCEDGPCELPKLIICEANDVEES